MGIEKLGVVAVLFLSLSAVATPKEISLPSDVEKQLKSFEPSAAMYLEDLDLFLIASDDTTEKDEPMLFLMDADGEVQSPAVKIKGIKKMTDVESISQDDDGTLYIMSSQSLNKNGKDKSERNLLVRAVRKNKKITSSDSVELRPLLTHALGQDVEESLDIESHFVREGELYIGLKEPQRSPGSAEILKIGKVDDIFAGELDVSEWKTIDFKAVSGEEDLLSDILLVDERFYLTTTQEKGTGRLWQYEEDADELTLLEEFGDLHPEGLAYNPGTNSLLVVFDEGGERALFTHVAAP